MEDSAWRKADWQKIDAIVQQLDLVKRLADAGYWLTTEELCQLLNQDGNALESLRGKEIGFRFVWRNFVCSLVSQQGNAKLWHLATISLPADSSNLSHNASLNAVTSVQKLSSNPAGVLPSYFVLVENFFTPTQLQALIQYVLEREAAFVPTSNSANDPTYRRSFYLPHFPEFAQLAIARVRELTPLVLPQLQLPPFAIGEIEAQLTAHNDGNYYKIHNDNGSPDTVARELTYVYYFCREPQGFSGGELTIYDSRIENNFYVAADSYKTIVPRNNTVVFFLSRYMHEVLPVRVPSQKFADSRFTINGWVRRA